MTGSVNAAGANADPNFSADGLRMYFASTRLGSAGDADIYYVDRDKTTGPWGTAVQLDSAINSDRMERAPFISADGLELYFMRSDRLDGADSSADVWVTNRQSLDSTWLEPKPVETINSDFADGFPMLSADGLSLYFNSRRPYDEGALEGAYVAHRSTLLESFGEPQWLFPGTVNYVSPDGLTLPQDSIDLGGSGGWDIFQRNLASTAENFGEAIHLQGRINTRFTQYSMVTTVDTCCVNWSLNRRRSRDR